MVESVDGNVTCAEDTDGDGIPNSEVTITIHIVEKELLYECMQCECALDSLCRTHVRDAVWESQGKALSGPKLHMGWRVDSLVQYCTPASTKILL